MPVRTYKCLGESSFAQDGYELIPIRDADKFLIMGWRNEQLDILRQSSPITAEQQENYFKHTVDELFNQEKPSQILWSFLLNKELIGYGGLVHIDWNAMHAEISFLLETRRNNNIDQFKTAWSNYLDLITDVAFNKLNFQKIHTYAYNIRDYYFEVLYQKEFVKEGHLKNHIMIKDRLEDVLILSKFKS
jgi:RimJ/RimL family protein N-acetyltransferase